MTKINHELPAYVSHLSYAKYLYQDMAPIDQENADRMKPIEAALATTVQN